jgi:hypothetical protein
MLPDHHLVHEVAIEVPAKARLKQALARAEQGGGLFVGVNRR